MRGALRSVAEHAIVLSGLDRALRRGLRGRLLVLAYHNVIPDGAGPVGDASLHIELARFREHLDVLTSATTVVSLDAASRGELDSARPNVVLTFDDAYVGTIELALPELARRGLPATLFVPVGLLGSQSCWWDEEAAAGRLDERSRDAALAIGWGLADRIRRPDREHPPLPRALAIATESDLQRVVSQGAVRLGAHTWNHPNLSALGAEDLAAELTSPLSWLGSRFASAMIPWVAYPYGLANATVMRAAAEAGYEGGLLVSGGWLSPGGAADRMAWPRLNVSAGLSRGGLALRLAGVLAR